MAADLHIHVIKDESQIPLIRDYFAYPGSESSDGDEWRRVRTVLYDGDHRTGLVLWRDDMPDKDTMPDGRLVNEYSPYTDAEIRKAISATKYVWVGEVSWLKAAMLDDPDHFIPSPVQAIQDIFNGGGNIIELTDEVIGKIMAAFELENTTQYTIEHPGLVEKFLRAHAGSKAFTISW